MPGDWRLQVLLAAACGFVALAAASLHTLYPFLLSDYDFKLDSKVKNNDSDKRASNDRTSFRLLEWSLNFSSTNFGTKEYRANER